MLRSILRSTDKIKRLRKRSVMVNPAAGSYNIAGLEKRRMFLWS
jgi:hypothetical protein